MAHPTRLGKEPLQGERINKFSVVEDLRAMCEEGQLKDAVNYFALVHQGGLQVVSDDYAFILQQCAKLKAFKEGQLVHQLLIESEMKSDVVLETNLLSMYAKCGSIADARQVFDGMHRKDVVAWTMMINVYAQRGDFKEVLKMFHQMRKRHVRPNRFTFICMLKACTCPADLKKGKHIHDHIIQRHLETDTYVGGALVGMYAKCGSISCARKVFNKIIRRNWISWNLMISIYVEHGQAVAALKLFQQTLQARVEPNEMIFVNVLKACISLADLEKGKQLHALICRSKFELDLSVGNSLVQLYIKCGSLQDAQCVDDQMHVGAGTMCMETTSMTIHCDNNDEEAKLFGLLHQQGIEPNKGKSRRPSPF